MASQLGAQVASSISQHSIDILSSPPRAQNQEVPFSRTSHRLILGARQTTGTVASYTSAASDTIASLAGSAGSAVASVYRNAAQIMGSTEADHGTSDDKQRDDRAMLDTRDAISTAFSGVAQGWVLRCTVSRWAPRSQC